MGVIHDNEFHNFAENRILELLSHTSRLLNPLQVSMQEVYHADGRGDQSKVLIVDGQLIGVDLEIELHLQATGSSRSFFFLYSG